MCKILKDYSNVDTIFDRFDRKYEIPGFLKTGMKSKVNLINASAWFFKWRIISCIEKLRVAYPSNLLKRAKATFETSLSNNPDLLNTQIISLMIEIIRIIRSGLIDEVPELKKTLIEVFDILPIGDPSFDLYYICYYDADDTFYTSEVFPRYIGLMANKINLTEDRKNRIQSVLKKRRDKWLFDWYTRAKIVAYERQCGDELTMAVMGVMNPTEDNLGKYDLATLETFLNQFDEKGMQEIRSRLGGDLDNENGYAEFYKLFCLYKGEDSMLNKDH